MSRRSPWALRPREGYCKACGFVVALGWRSGLLKPHAQAWARRRAENGLSRSDDRLKNIEWCKGGGKTPTPMPRNPVDPWAHLDKGHVDHD